MKGELEKMSKRSFFLMKNEILVINKMGAIEIAAIKNLQTIISGASAYWPTNFALVQDKPHDNIASIIKVFRVKSLRDSIKLSLHSKDRKICIWYGVMLN